MKTLNFVSTLAAAMVFTIAAYAQDKSQRPVTDQTQVQNLSAELNSRTPVTKGKSIQWLESEYGYTGLYADDNTLYMASYDRDGNYIETFKKRDWNDPSISSSFKSTLNTSQYKDQQVVSFWEVYDLSTPTRKGYYLEVQDKTGKKSRVWGDDTGKFYDKPYEHKP